LNVTTGLVLKRNGERKTEVGGQTGHAQLHPWMLPSSWNRPPPSLPWCQ